MEKQNGNPLAAAPARSLDLAMVRDSAERQRADAEMITGLCDTVYRLTAENQALKAKIAELTPSEAK
jgi:hypothetical protein